MASKSIEKKLLEELSRLPSDRQQRVLDYARTLAAGRVGLPGKELLSFSGAIESGDLEEMARAIEEACERIDSNEW